MGDVSYRGSAALAGSAIGANVPAPNRVFDSIFAAQENHAAELQNIRQRLSDLADRFSGMQPQDARSGGQAPKEVPSTVVRKYEMLTEDVGQYLEQIRGHLSRLETL